MIITSVEAVTIRTTNAVLPRYGASSPLRNSQNHPKGLRDSGRLCAMAAISLPSNHNHR
jgi:hypothetical protein